MKTGVVVGIEGIDGSGKTSLALNLASALEGKGLEVAHIGSQGMPAFETLEEYIISGGVPYDPYAHFLLSCAHNRLLRASTIEMAVAEGAVVLAERYCYSAVAYTVVLGAPLDWCLQVVSVIEPPDIVLYCDLPADVSAHRKQQKRVDRAETGFGAEDLSREGFTAFQSRVRDIYLQLSRLDPSRWHVVSTQDGPNYALEQALVAIERVLG